MRILSLPSSGKARTARAAPAFIKDIEILAAPSGARSLLRSLLLKLQRHHDLSRLLDSSRREALQQSQSSRQIPPELRGGELGLDKPRADVGTDGVISMHNLHRLADAAVGGI
jgi:hypothetical protein